MLAAYLVRLCLFSAWLPPRAPYRQRIWRPGGSSRAEQGPVGTPAAGEEVSVAEVCIWGMAGLWRGESDVVREPRSVRLCSRHILGSIHYKRRVL